MFEMQEDEDSQLDRFRLLRAVGLEMGHARYEAHVRGPQMTHLGRGEDTSSPQALVGCTVPDRQDDATLDHTSRHIAGEDVVGCGRACGGGGRADDGRASSNHGGASDGHAGLRPPEADEGKSNGATNK